MNRIIVLANILVAGMMAFMLTACNENDPVDPVGDAPSKPTGLMARSSSETSVALKWTAGPATETVTGYEIQVNETGSASVSTVEAGTGTTVTVTGLTEGKLYEFAVVAKNGSAKSTASAKVEWAPARVVANAYRLYSSRNTTMGSGLAIWTGAVPEVLKIVRGHEWDICFDDKTKPADPRIASPGQTEYIDAASNFPNGQPARITYWGPQLVNITSLDEVYMASPLTVPASGGEMYWSLGSIGGTMNWGSVIASKNSDGTYNFGRIMVKRVGTSFVQGTGNDTFIEVMIAYQTMKDVPYALKAILDAEPNRTPRISVND